MYNINNHSKHAHEAICVIENRDSPPSVTLVRESIRRQQ